jgi:hypothetical protein
MGMRKMGAVIFTRAWRSGEDAEGAAPDESRRRTLQKVQVLVILMSGAKY